MNLTSRYQKLLAAHPGIRSKVKLSRHSTFKIGGPADLFFEAKLPEQLVEVIKQARKFKVPYLLIGGGSNLLFDDKGFRGLVVKYSADRIEVDKKTNTATAMAGCSLNRLVKQLAFYNLGGIDFLANIPGTLGGAIVGNAGCYGRGIKEVLLEIELLEASTGQVYTVSPEKLKFSYRHSILKEKPNWIVLSAKLQLVADGKVNILKRIEAERQERLRKHPHAPCAGSFFKNPPGEAAWKIIDAAGMRGYTIGGARVSNKHPNHLINYQSATATEMKKLAERVTTTVKRRVGVKLEPEVRYVKAEPASQGR